MLDFKSCTNVSESCLNNICSSFTLIDIFQKIPKVNNLFGPLLKINLLPRTFKNRPIWSHCPQPWFKVVNLVVLDWHFYEKSERQILGYLTPETFKAIRPFRFCFIKSSINWSRSTARQRGSAHLVERLLPTPEVRGLNPVIGKLLYGTFFLSTVLKRRK